MKWKITITTTTRQLQRIPVEKREITKNERGLIKIGSVSKRGWMVSMNDSI